MKQEKIIFSIKELIINYFENRNFKIILNHMEERTSWIGTGKNELSHNLNEAKTALSKELIEHSAQFKVIEDDLHYIPISSQHVIVYGTLCAIPNDVALAKEDLRISAVIHISLDKLTILHLHFSHADHLLDDGSYYVKQTKKLRNDNLMQELSIRDAHLENLTKNIPGGMHKCAHNHDLTLLSVSDEFLSMVSYTREEIQQKFDDKYILMIHPSDRLKIIEILSCQIQEGNDIDLEYRLLSKDNKELWVLDKGRLIDDGNGEFCYYCLLIDITQRKQQQEELRLSLERHQVIMDQATDIIFEWDMTTDTLSFSSNWEKKFGYPPIDSNISQLIPLSKNIHQEDMPVFIHLMENTMHGVPYFETEFRIRNDHGRFFWCRIRATTQYNTEGQPIKAIGIIIDIDHEKKQKQELLLQAQLDVLTGLYNKTTMISLVEERMCSKEFGGYQALLILDIDYFKAVNDTYGHLCGDFVLSHVSSALKKNFRSSDLIGRIGGDEFLVYLAGIQDKQTIVNKAKQLLHSISKIVPASNTKPISCSIGVIVVPHNSMDYETLFQYADTALYHRKHNGRNGVSFWNNDMVSLHLPLNTTDSKADFNEPTVLKDQLPQYVFKALYTSNHTESTINQLLEVIGNTLDVSRVYIFEESVNGCYYLNTFEWCKEGITSKKDFLQNIGDYHELFNYKDNFNKEGIFNCPDIKQLPPNLYKILNPQGICSMLQCAMLDEGKFVGFIGFDECRENHFFSSIQLDSFKWVADILSTFIIKLRQKKT